MSGKLMLKDYLRLSMLIALTVVLGYLSGFLRIGNISKLSLSFIPVFVAAYFYGGLPGGIVGAAADFISYIFNPTGIFLWQLCLIEFAYGFIFGLFFHGRKNYYTLRLIICVVIQLIINIFVKTPILMSVGYAPSDFWIAVSMRLPGVIAGAVLQIIFLGISAGFIPRLLKR